MNLLLNMLNNNEEINNAITIIECFILSPNVWTKALLFSQALYNRFIYELTFSARKSGSKYFFLHPA